MFSLAHSYLVRIMHYLQTAVADIGHWL